VRIALRSAPRLIRPAHPTESATVTSFSFKLKLFMRIKYVVLTAQTSYEVATVRWSALRWRAWAVACS
jgi:hypothetical protein